MELLVIFPPLLAFLFVGLLGKRIGDKGAQLVTCGGIIVAAIASVTLLFDVFFGGEEAHSYVTTLGSWIDSGDFSVDWAIKVDQLSVVMMCVITVVSSCIHVYSIGYMSHDEHKARFMSYLSLFSFAMLMLVSADNLLQLFFGWEGVGLSSYLLIGFWNKKDTANAAAVKAFIVNRVGDLGFLLGIFAMFVLFKSVEFETIFVHAPEMAERTLAFLGFEFHAVTLICLLLFVGAMGKSAQLGLHVWLPDAMEGPTPVSALIHAATMVTAGVFLVARFSPLYEYAPTALIVVTLVGAATAFVGASIALVQFDIKRVIAYSTISQLGYMFFALGVSAYGAAIFHLMTHAFFKALLFLGAGSVIHAMSDEQDMRKMGGLWKKIPITYGLMWVGSLALAGMPFFAGYYSKDIILEAAFADHSWWGQVAYWVGITAALMTAFYSWRLLFMTFHGTSRVSNEVAEKVHESPAVMLGPLFVLAIGAVFAGFSFYESFVGHHPAWHEAIKVLVENDTIVAAHEHIAAWAKWLPSVVAVLGIGVAYLFYMSKPHLPGIIINKIEPVYYFLCNKWFFDKLYNFIFVGGAVFLGRLFWAGDRKLIDKYGPNGTAYVSYKFAKLLSRFQSGYVFQYAFIMIIAVVVFMSWFVFRTEYGW